MTKFLCHFAVFVTLLLICECYELRGNRNKRTLIYIPPGGVVQMVMGFGLPMSLNPESVIIGVVIKAGYGLPHNSSHFTHPGVTYAKKKREISRWDLYDTMIQVAQVHGFGGKECVLRTICEVAQVPIDKNEGLLEELAHVIFTPSSTEEKVKRHTDSIYHAAEQLGKEIGACQVLFPECQVSFANMFTKMRNY